MDSAWDYTDTDYSPSYPSTSPSSVVGLDLDLSPKCHVTEDTTLATWRREQITPAMSNLVPSVVMNAFRSVDAPLPTPPPSAPIPIPRSTASEEKRWSSSLWRFSFPRSSSPPHQTEERPRSRRGSFTDSFPFSTFFSSSPAWGRRSPSLHTPEPSPPAVSAKHEQCRQQAPRARQKRLWFSPGKLFATAGAS
jgi:hypothetical protein